MQVDWLTVVFSALAGASLVAHVLAFVLIFRQKRELAEMDALLIGGFRSIRWDFLEQKFEREGCEDGRNN